MPHTQEYFGNGKATRLGIPPTTLVPEMIITMAGLSHTVAARQSDDGVFPTNDRRRSTIGHDTIAQMVIVQHRHQPAFTPRRSSVSFGGLCNRTQ